MPGEIKTAGELRSFLTQVLTGIKEGTVTPTQAQAIAKVSAQINQSLMVEVNTALQLERMGKDRPVAGTMQLGNSHAQPEPAVELPQVVPTGVAQRELDKITEKLRDDLQWCEQCDMMIAPEVLATCRSRFCSLKATA